MKVDPKDSPAAVESINDRLFSSFDPDEEKNWLVGGSGNVSGGGNYNPAGFDAGADVDYSW